MTRKNACEVLRIQAEEAMVATIFLTGAVFQNVEMSVEELGKMLKDTFKWDEPTLIMSVHEYIFLFFIGGIVVRMVEDVLGDSQFAVVQIEVIGNASQQYCQKICSCIWRQYAFGKVNEESIS